jgi:hypothetical protein
VITHDLSQIESKDRTNWGFVTIWRLNRNPDMKGRRMLEKSERWWKHNAGLRVSSRRTAFSTQHLKIPPPRRKSKCFSTPTFSN